MKHVLLVPIIVMYYARYWRQNHEQKFPSKKMAVWWTTHLKITCKDHEGVKNRVLQRTCLGESVKICPWK